MSNREDNEAKALVLRTLMKDGPLAKSVVARRCAITSYRINRILEEMEEDEFISFEPNMKATNPQGWYSPTNEGRKWLDKQRRKHSCLR